MAVTNIFATNIFFSNWGLVGSASAITAMQDGDPTTYYSNYNPTFVHDLQMYSNASPPANFIGSTITNVSVFYGLTASLNKGTFTAIVVRAGTPSSIVLTPPIVPGVVNFTSARPGGGTWVHTDFFNSNLRWGLTSNGDADDSTKHVQLTECYMVVTYTPVSAPVAAFTASTTTGTSPLTVNFTDQSTNSPTSWLWSFGDSTTTNAQHPTHVYSTNVTSTYTVTLTATNGGGSDDEVKSSYITVDPFANPAVAAFTATPVSGVQNLGVQFFDGSTGNPTITSWSWAFGDGAVSTEQNPLHVYTTVGVYTVTLTAANTTPTTDSEVKTSYITVASGTPVPLAQASTTTGFRPLTVQFTGSATNALPISWSWDFGDGTDSVAQSPLHVYATVGTYTPILTVTNEIGTASTTVGPITVNFSTITADFTAAPLMGYLPLTVRFTDESSGDAHSWAWDFGDGTAVVYGQYPVHIYRTNAGVATLTTTETSQSHDPNLRNHLIHYWKMEEATGMGDRADFIGSNPLTPSQSSAQVTGKHDFAATIPGTPGQMITSSPAIDFVSAWSFAFWWKSPDVTQGLATFGPAGGVKFMHVNANSAKLTLTATGSTSVTGPTTLSNDTFYHIVYTWNGVDTYKAYLNGALEATLTGAQPSDGTLFRIQTGSNVAHVFDEVAMYDIELPLSTVQALYNNGDGIFFETLASSDTDTLAGICPIIPDKTWGYFFEELKYVLMEPTFDQNVCQGFDTFGGIEQAVALTQQRLKRFVIETAALRKEATLSAADANSENFALPSDLIELLRVEVDGVAFYPGDPQQVDMDSTALNVYYQRDALSITIPGTFGTVPVVKVLYTYVPATPTVPNPCTCPTPPATGPWAAFPLPYVLWWIIRYGVMADMLNQAGERNDILRAKSCEEQFSFGVQLYKFLYAGS